MTSADVTTAMRTLGRADAGVTSPALNAGDLDKMDIATLLGQARKASDLLKALAHENRLIILCLLCKGEKSVSELEDTMGMPQAAVSQQLARLRFDRLVETRRDGRMIYYSIADPQVAAVIMSLYAVFCAPVIEAGQQPDGK